MLNDVDREQSTGIDRNCLNVPPDSEAKAFFWVFSGDVVRP